MDNQNICKFIPKADAELLTAENFIYETVVSYSHEQRIRSFHSMYLVAEGTGSYRCDGITHPLSCGTLFFSFAGVPFILENGGDLKFYYISFSGGRADALFRRFGVTPANSVFTGYEGVIPLWRDSLVRADTDNVDLLSESMVMYVFSKLKKERRENPDAASDVLAYMEKHFTEPGISLNTVAEAVGYHAKYVSHMFKQRFGMGFTEYLRNMRVRHAVMLMENGVTCVKNVAFLSGFSDPLYFSKVFTKTVGVSPRDFIRGEKAKTTF